MIDMKKFAETIDKKLESGRMSYDVARKQAIEEQTKYPSSDDQYEDKYQKPKTKWLCAADPEEHKKYIGKIMHMVCQECERPYGFEIFNNDGKNISDNFKGQKPPIDLLRYDKERDISHGICPDCTPEVYNRNGLTMSHNTVNTVLKWIQSRGDLP